MNILYSLYRGFHTPSFDPIQNTSYLMKINKDGFHTKNNLKNNF